MGPAVCEERRKVLFRSLLPQEGRKPKVAVWNEDGVQMTHVARSAKRDLEEYAEDIADREKRTGDSYERVDTRQKIVKLWNGQVFAAIELNDQKPLLGYVSVHDVKCIDKKPGTKRGRIWITEDCCVETSLKLESLLKKLEAALEWDMGITYDPIKVKLSPRELHEYYQNAGEDTLKDWDIMLRYICSSSNTNIILNELRKSIPKRLKAFARGELRIQGDTPENQGQNSAKYGRGNIPMESPRNRQ